MAIVWLVAEVLIIMRAKRSRGEKANPVKLNQLRLSVKKLRFRTGSTSPAELVQVSTERANPV